MYLFSRTARLGEGNPQKQLDWALRMTEKVNQISEIPVQLWTTVFSPTSGRLVWTANVENLLELETIENKLIADSGYVTLVEEGGAHTSGDPIDDGLLQFIHADPNSAGDRCPVRDDGAGDAGTGRHRQGDRARSGDRGEGQQDHRLPDFVRHERHGSLRVGRVDHPLRLHRGHAARRRTIAADASFNEKVDKELSKVYLPGVTTQTAFRKVA